MARAGPEMQAKLLGGLGLKGFMVMDGKNTINLMDTVSGMVGGGDKAAQMAMMGHGGKMIDLSK
jgi:major vault protein